MRIFIPLTLVVLFFGWALYRLLIKKDLKQNMNAFFAGLFFAGVWGVLYWFIVS